MYLKVKANIPSMFAHLQQHQSDFIKAMKHFMFEIW